MKQMWLIYLDDEYQGMQWEASEEEALAAYRSCNFPPEDEDRESLYPGDKPMKVTARLLQEGKSTPKTKRERQYEELRALVSQMPFSVIHTGTRRDEHGFVDTFSIDIESYSLHGGCNGLEFLKARDDRTLEERELAFVYGPDAERQREKALRYLRHYGTFPILPDPILSYEQALELRSAFRESFGLFEKTSQAFKDFGAAMLVQGNARFEAMAVATGRQTGKSHLTIREFIESLPSDERTKKPGNKGPQPRKKWPKRWKV